MIIANHARHQGARLDAHGLVNHSPLLRVITHFDIADQREILTERMTDKTIIGENATQIGMTGEDDAEQVERLARLEQELLELAPTWRLWPVVEALQALRGVQWIVALTRIISAVFRKGGDVTFLVEEMKAVFDPRGGYFKAGGVYMPSIVAEIGFAMESHMKMIGLIKEEQMPAAQREMILAKRAEYDNLKGEAKGEDNGDFPADAKLCAKCVAKAVIIMDGCLTCLNCGDSKCG